MDEHYEIALHDVSKAFGKKTALDKVSLKVKKGSIFGLMGPNGAGKSTLTRILATLSLPDEGTVTISDLDVVSNVKPVRKKVGVTFQQTTVFSTGTAWENLWIAGKMYGMRTSKIKERGEYLLKEFNLHQVSNDLVGTYSGGMKRKLDIAISLLHQPEVLLLDEPTTGLDPEARNTLWQIISTISYRERTTIFVTTHYLDELNDVATDIALMNNGKILDMGTPKELINQLAADHIEIHYSTLNPTMTQTLDEYVSDLTEVVDYQIKPTSLTVISSKGQEILSKLLKFLIHNDADIASSELKQANLNDLYLANFKEKGDIQ
ncbi:ABC transporter ATP-binding protein [Paenibacillus sp. J2TS4]|uniref:ABC transporter ATP-binding protein n=1 Tax=Paenibacillus sp. J2TS4 TaxID=2807194 RepID=UPI001B2EA78E|nr:ABC transporter ATP-binding protein [Paenibacillus sp. J2TS4]GIP31930.1 daunorubicin resistance protein DrrA family ABC transporter ATP-binding protein [Paenibacillus sp. J2TS4]